jgi:hypothetical protein
MRVCIRGITTHCCSVRKRQHQHHFLPPALTPNPLTAATENVLISSKKYACVYHRSCPTRPPLSSSCVARAPGVPQRRPVAYMCNPLCILPHPPCSLLSHAASDLDVTVLLEPPADRQSKDEHERLMRGFCKGLSRSHQAPKMRSQYDFYYVFFSGMFFFL